MRRIGLLAINAAVLIAMTVLPSVAWAVPPSPQLSRAAIFIGLKDGETLFVERVRDVPGGFRGEVSVGGASWVRYRVELSPEETIRRYELEVAPRPGDLPRPVLVAHRGRDSILIQPRPGAGFPATRLAVPPSAIMASTEIAVFELAIRHGMRLDSSRAEFPMISAWTGKHFDAVVEAMGRDKVRLTTVDTWEFTLDRHRRIMAGRRLGGHEADAHDPWAGIRIVRLDPALGR